MESQEANFGDGVFPHTRWTFIGRLKNGSPSEAQAALDVICKAYWYPLYVYTRRLGLDEMDGKDAVQDLFAKLVERNRLALADAARGKLRTFLLTALKNQIGQNRERQLAAKRGGGKPVVELDLTDAEGRYVHEVEGREVSPERAYERKWAVELLRLAQERLRGNYALGGKAALFDALAPALLDTQWSDHEVVANDLGMTDGAVKVALHRLRERYRDALLLEVAKTVEREDEVRDEVEYLLGLFGGSR